MTPSLKNKMVFIVSVKPESSLQIPEGENVAFDGGNAYAKIFDFTLNLNPIHFSDYGSVLLDIINLDRTGAKAKLKKLLCKDFNCEDHISLNENINKLPKSFYWIIKGQNLTVRDLKDRLNQAISLFASLQYKKYKVESSLNFSTCAAVAYLQSQYSELYYFLIEHEYILENIVRGSYSIRNSGSNDKVNELTVLLGDFMKMAKPPKNIEELKRDLVKMIIDGDIDDDYRMYFYSYPKGSHIKTSDEKDISNLLFLPNDFKEDELLNEKVNRIIAKDHENNFIVDCFKKFEEDEELPPIILKNEYLFAFAMSNMEEKVLRLVSTQISWNKTSFDKNKIILETINGYDFVNKESLYKCYTLEVIKDWFPNSKPDNICAIRKVIIEAIGYNVQYFRELFLMESVPIVSEDELSAIEPISVALNLIDYNKIAENSFAYISNRINMDPLNEKDFARAEKIYNVSCGGVLHNIIANPLLDFLIINKSVNDVYFGLISGEFFNVINDYDKICNYVKSIEPSLISDAYLANLDRLNILNGLSPEVLNKLESRNFYQTYLLSMQGLNQLDSIKYRDERVIRNILSSCKEINKAYPDIIIDIRKSIIKNSLPNVEEYLELFHGEYPVITKEELNGFKVFSEALHFINGTKVNINNYNFIWEYCNQDSRSADECFAIINIFNTENEYHITDAETIFYIIHELDFGKIAFRDMSTEQKEESVDILQVPLALNVVDKCMQFMSKTNCLVGSLELVAQDVIEDQKYIDLINEINVPTEQTIDWISNQTIAWPLKEEITSILFEQKDYKNYIIGKTLNDGYFEFNPLKINLDEYNKVFARSDIVYEIMAKNDYFLNAVITSELYTFLDLSRLRMLYRMRQPIALVKYLFEKLDKEQILEYLSNCGDLNKKEDSAAFLDLICLEENYIKLNTKEIREIAKNKLWEPSEKGKFTRFMNSRE